MLNHEYPALRYIAQVDEGGFLEPIRSSLVDVRQGVVTFDELLRRTPFAAHMRTILSRLEQNYNGPVDTEFTVELLEPAVVRPQVVITLLQCRPQSQLADSAAAQPACPPAPADILFSTRRMVPRGALTGVGWVLYVPPAGYFSLASAGERQQLVRAIGSLNALLKEQTFICVGPGRWGTSTPDMGVGIGYGDIYHTRALVELTGSGIGPDLQPSFGTHFFQDLVEAHIYPLNVNLDDHDASFNRKFFDETPNHLAEFLAVDDALLGCLRLIRVQDYRPGASLSLVMDDDANRATAFLQPAS